MLPCDIASITVTYTLPLVPAINHSKPQTPAVPLTADTPASSTPASAGIELAPESSSLGTPADVDVTDPTPVPRRRGNRGAITLLTTRLKSLQIACMILQEMGNVKNWTAIFEGGGAALLADENLQSKNGTVELATGERWRSPAALYRLIF